MDGALVLAVLLPAAWLTVVCHDDIISMVRVPSSYGDPVDPSSSQGFETIPLC